MAFITDNCTFYELTDDILAACQPFVCGNDDLDDFFQKVQYIDLRTRFLLIQSTTDVTNTINMAKKVYLGMIADIMHPGLINIINEGAKYGDVIIGLYTDKAIATHKRLPYLTYEQRETVVRSIHGDGSYGR